MGVNPGLFKGRPFRAVPPDLRIPAQVGQPIRGQSGHHSDVKAATRSEAKAATCSDVKAATFRPSSEWVAGLPPE
jgi:hypothetical protein